MDGAVGSCLGEAEGACAAAEGSVLEESVFFIMKNPLSLAYCVYTGDCKFDWTWYGGTLLHSMMTLARRCMLVYAPSIRTTTSTTITSTTVTSTTTSTTTTTRATSTIISITSFNITIITIITTTFLVVSSAFFQLDAQYPLTVVVSSVFCQFDARALLLLLLLLLVLLLLLLLLLLVLLLPL